MVQIFEDEICNASSSFALPLQYACATYRSNVITSITGVVCFIVDSLALIAVVSAIPFFMVHPHQARGTNPVPLVCHLF